jgi:hypothetical protein
MGRRSIRVLSAFAAAGLGVVLASAGVEKLVRPVEAANAMAAYGLVPIKSIALLSPAMAAAEVLIGFALFSSAQRRHGAQLGAALLLVFLLAQSQALVRGISTDCGCGGVKDSVFEAVGLPSSLSLFSIAGTALMAAAALFVVHAEVRRHAKTPNAMGRTAPDDHLRRCDVRGDHAAPLAEP